MHNITEISIYQPTFLAHRGVLIKKAILRGYLEKGLNVLQIAEILKTKPSNVDYMIKAYELTPEGLAKLKEIENKVISLRNKRATHEQIVQETGLTMNAVKTIIKNLCIQNPKEKTLIINRGKNSKDSFEKAYEERMNRLKEKNKSSREEKRLKKCREILDLHAKGFSIEEIAKALSCSVSNIKGYFKYLF